MVAAYARRDLLTLTLILAVCAGLLSWAFPGLVFVFVGASALIWIAVALFFRDPRRVPPSEPGVIVAPADGKVVEIAEAEEPHFLGLPAHKVAIFMSVFDVHVNRSPCEGELVGLDHRPGQFMNALRAEASVQNEANLISIRNTEVDEPVLVKQIAGLVARRVVCACRPGQSLARGERIGMVKFGSRAEVFVGRSREFRWRVQLGDKVKAGETILGEWVR